MDVAWFRDGTKIVASGRGMPKERTALWIVSTLTGTLQKLREDVWGGAPSPDGSRIAFFNGIRNELWLMGAGGENPHKLLGPIEGDRFQGITWSPDSRKIAYLRVRLSGEDTIDTFDVAGAPPTTIVSGRGLRSCYWAPDGRMLYSLANRALQTRTADLWEVRTNPHTGHPSGQPRRILAGAGFSFPGLSLSADGKRLAYLRTLAQSDVMIAELEAGGTRMRPPRRLTLDDRADWPTGWFRDSRQILFYSDRNGSFDVFKQGIDAPMPELIAHGPEHERGAQVSPDGNWILYFSSPEPAPGESLAPERLMRVPVSGGSPQFVLESGGFPGPPPISSERTPLDRRQYPALRCAASSTGRCVLGEAKQRQFIFSEFNPLGGDKRELARLNLDPSILFVWDLSPDGSRVAVAERLQSGKIRIIDLNTAAVRDLTVDWANLDSIGWSADGQALFTTSYASTGETLLHVTLGGEVHVLYKYSTWFERPYASPDGRYLAFAQLYYDSNAWMIDNFR